MPELFTLAFFQELVGRLNGDEEWKRKGGDLTTRIVATCTDRDASFLLDIQDGQVRVSAVEAEEPADFKFEGAYEAWATVAKGERDLQTLVMTGKMRFKGSLSKVMAMMSPLGRLTAVLREMPTEI